MLEILVILYACSGQCDVVKLSGNMVFGQQSIEQCEQDLPSIIEEFQKDDKNAIWYGECKLGDILDKDEEGMSS